MRVRDWLKLFVPPIAVSGYRRFRGSARRSKPEWEYLAEGWRAASGDRRIKGWNVADVVEAQKLSRIGFVKRTISTGPFDVSPEATDQGISDLVFHNTVMCYAYVLALAARRKKCVSILDWGGGLGYYYLIGQNLIPGLKIDYHCKDVAVLADYGQSLWPDAHFYTDSSCLERQYDFVLASCSIHYSQNWNAVLQALTQATREHLFVTRVPIAKKVDSYVFVQRPYAYGYNTEYIGWCLNRDEFLSQSETYGLRLVREFVTGERPVIQGAPEQCEYRGFLFQPILRADT